MSKAEEIFGYQEVKPSTRVEAWVRENWLPKEEFDPVPGLTKLGFRRLITLSDMVWDNGVYRLLNPPFKVSLETRFSSGHQGFLSYRLYVREDVEHNSTRIRDSEYLQKVILPVVEEEIKRQFNLGPFTTPEPLVALPGVPWISYGEESSPVNTIFFLSEATEELRKFVESAQRNVESKEEM